MSRPAAATQQKPEPRIRRVRFAEEDLVSTFGERAAAAGIAAQISCHTFRATGITAYLANRRARARPGNGGT